MSKIQKSGRCIFCDGTGLSKQHVWPDWLKNIIPRNYEKNIQNLSHPIYSKDEKIVFNRIVIEKQGHMGVRKIRNVCSICNNGWMSKIEQEVKPLLTSMILGEKVILDKVEQTNISKWIIMTSIMAEFTDTKSMAIPAEHRKHLFKTLIPPKGWKIWIGKYNDIEWDFAYRHYGFYVTNPEEAKKIKAGIMTVIPNTQVSTFVIGNFFVHCSNSPFDIFHKDFDKIVEPVMKKIWPINHENISWPPLEIISDELAYTIADKFAFEFQKNN